MAIKTQVGKEDVLSFLQEKPEPQKTDSLVLLDMMKSVTGLPPQLWGGAIVGFGTYDYQQKGGTSGSWFLTGFAPRKQNISIYIMTGFPQYENLLKKLGPHKTGMGCLYIKKLTDIDLSVLKEMIESSFHQMKAKYA
ncbi:DUF1801 domain-containing protein [Sediminibacterium goheungense]|uniref:Uncharacterized protein DUF1801 n=1 Tax=Sediminibacterium goheungense TaxID=1086393 RepID=A0A4R6J3X9_9BACT|nr:DUF1801 domain-containing protein [Sediminibacterium goheungense]TDO28905.1 uncharacterized protein DUF1801 [Sediminibacterium goheungense]